MEEPAKKKAAVKKEKKVLQKSDTTRKSLGKDLLKNIKKDNEKKVNTKKDKPSSTKLNIEDKEELGFTNFADQLKLDDLQEQEAPVQDKDGNYLGDLGY